MNKISQFVLAPVIFVSVTIPVFVPKEVDAFTLDNRIDNQELSYLLTSTFQIESSTGKCLDVQWGGKSIRTPIQFWDCNRTEAQVWRPLYSETGDESKGWFSLQNVGSSLCLDVQWGNFNVTTPLWLWECNGTPAQTFNLLGTFEDFWAFDQIAVSGSFDNQCLDSDDGTSRTGVPISLFYCRDPWSFGGRATSWHLSPLRITPGGYFPAATVALPSDDTAGLPSDEIAALLSSETTGLPSDEIAALPSDEIAALLSSETTGQSGEDVSSGMLALGLSGTTPTAQGANVAGVPEPHSWGGGLFAGLGLIILRQWFRRRKSQCSIKF